MKSILKTTVPPYVFEAYHKIKRLYWQNIYKSKTARDVFTHIYQSNQWGGQRGKYFSGTGSDEYNASLYSEVVKKFIKDKNIKRIVDLGCGDFTVGSKLQVEGVDYIGIDVVEKVIEKNQQNHGNTNISFYCLDIVSDELPNSDLCLIRQVLQHLSNNQISSILQKSRNYKYVLITEHYPSTDTSIIPNKDKVHGYDTRLQHNSAVYLDLPPFCMKISGIFLDIEETAEGGRLRTYLIEN